MPFKPPNRKMTLCPQFYPHLLKNVQCTRMFPPHRNCRQVGCWVSEGGVAVQGWGDCSAWIWVLDFYRPSVWNVVALNCRSLIITGVLDNGNMLAHKKLTTMALGMTYVIGPLQQHKLVWIPDIQISLYLGN